MQSLSLMLSKRLSNSKPLFRITSNLIAYASSSSTTTSSPSSPPPTSPPSPIAVADTANGNGWASSTLDNLLTSPWSATQSRGIAVSGSDVRVGNLIGNQGRISKVLKQYHSLEGRGKATIKVPSHTVAGYATVATTGDIRRKENSGPETKREQLLKFTAAVPLLMIYPNAYSLLLANLFVFWHINAGIQEILADYIHQEMTREFILISLRLFLIIAMKDVFLKFVFV